MTLIYIKTLTKTISLILAQVAVCAGLGYPADNLRKPLSDEIRRADAAISHISNHAAERFNEDRNRELSRLITSRLPFIAPSPGSIYAVPLEYNGAAYPVEYWLMQVSDDKQNLAYMRIGHLFFLDKRYYKFLPESTTQALGRNLILLKDFDESQLAPIHYTALTIIAMIHEDFKDKHVIDVGSGAGILSFAAWKLGAVSFDLIDKHGYLLYLAKENFKINGEKEKTRIKYKTIKKDMEPNAGFAEILKKITHSSLDTAVISNIGYWPKIYRVSNADSIGLVAQLMQRPDPIKVRLFISGGNCFFDKVPSDRIMWPSDPKQVIQNDQKLITQLGFQVVSKAYAEIVPLRSNWMMLLLSGVKNDNPPRFLTWAAVAGDTRSILRAAGYSRAAGTGILRIPVGVEKERMNSALVSNESLPVPDDEGSGQAVVWQPKNILFRTVDEKSVAIVGRMPQATGKEQRLGPKIDYATGKKVLDSSDGLNIAEIEGANDEYGKPKRFVLKHEVSEAMLKRYPSDYTLRDNGERTVFAMNLLRLLLEEEFKEYDIMLPEVLIVEDADSGQRFIATEYIESAKPLKSRLFDRDDSRTMASYKNHELLDVYCGFLLYMDDREFLLKGDALIPFDLETALAPVYYMKNGQIDHGYNATGYFLKGQVSDYKRIAARIKDFMLDDNGLLKADVRKKIASIIKESGLTDSVKEIKLDSDTFEVITADKILAFLEAQANLIEHAVSQKHRIPATMGFVLKQTMPAWATRTGI